MKTLLMSLLLLTVSATQAYDFKAVSEKHILPGYQRLSDKTASLHSLGKSYCSKPDNDQLEQLRNHYRGAFLAWQAMQHIRFGPIQYLTREHRFEMWPDKRGSVSKHLTRLQQDPDIHKADFDISSKSVAVQGFSALERLVFADKPIDATDCPIIVAVTGNLQQMSASLVGDWKEGDSAYAGFFNTAAAGNDFFESDTELASQILNSLYTQLEFIVTQKLDRPLGNDIGKARGKRAESWRSQLSLDAIQANLDATQQLYQLTFSSKLSKALAEQISQAFQQSLLNLAAIRMPLHQAVAIPVQRQQLLEFREQVSVLKSLIARDLASELGLSLGFNSLDGD